MTSLFEHLAPAAFRALKNYNSSSYDSYKANQAADTGAGVYALDKNKGGIDEASIMNDPIFQLESQKADLLYPGGGGGGGSRVIGSSYGGPSIGSIQQYGREGEGKISSLYAALDQYLQGQAGNTAQLYSQGTQAITGGYDKAAADIAKAQADAAANIAAQGALGGAGEGAAKEAQAAAAAAIGRQAAVLQSNKANALAGQTSASQGQQAISSNFMSGSQLEKGAQTGKWQTQVNNLISKAQQEMAAAAARDQAANAAANAKAASGAGKNQAAHLSALEGAIKRAQSDQKSGNKFSGIQGVLAYANKIGRPDLGVKLMDMIHSAPMAAAQQNAQAKADRVIGKQTPTTTAGEYLQNLLANSAGQNPIDLADPNTDPRGDLLKLVRNDPKLSFLKQYIINSPEEAKRQGQYQSAFGMSQKDYESRGGNAVANAAKGAGKGAAWWFAPVPMAAKSIWDRFHGGGQGPVVGDNSEAALNQRFTPFLNLDMLRQNQPAVHQYYDYFNQGNKEQDMLTTLYNIYQGKWGTGSF